MMRYEEAKLEIVRFQAEDVICTSNDPVYTDPTDNWGKEDWDN